MAYLTFTEVEAASALVNARGLGRVNWKRKTESSGSGKDRPAGQFHGYAVTSARVAQVAFGRKDAPVFHTMLVIVLTSEQIAENIAKGGSPLAWRNLNMGTILSLNPA
jgi:hypothetical protein